MCHPCTEEWTLEDHPRWPSANSMSSLYQVCIRWIRLHTWSHDHGTIVHLYLNFENPGSKILDVKNLNFQKKKFSILNNWSRQMVSRA